MRRTNRLSFPSTPQFSQILPLSIQPTQPGTPTDRSMSHQLVIHHIAQRFFKSHPNHATVMSHHVTKPHNIISNCTTPVYITQYYTTNHPSMPWLLTLSTMPIIFWQSFAAKCHKMVRKSHVSITQSLKKGLQIDCFVQLTVQNLKGSNLQW